MYIGIIAFNGHGTQMPRAAAIAAAGIAASSRARSVSGSTRLLRRLSRPSSATSGSSAVAIAGPTLRAVRAIGAELLPSQGVDRPTRPVERRSNDSSDGLRLDRKSVV